MKSLIVSLLMFGAAQGFAQANASVASSASSIQDVATRAHVDMTCAAKIIAATTQLCEQSSTAAEGESRDHACSYTFNLPPADGDYVEIQYTVGNSDEWSFDVTISVPTSCDFSVKAAE